MAIDTRFVRAIHHLAASLPLEIVHSLASALQNTSGAQFDWQFARMRATNAIHSIPAKASVSALFDQWQVFAPQMTGDAIALALLTAAEAEEYHRLNMAVELVWTGPDMTGSQLRRTDQALLELINSAKRHILIVSFAVYDIGELATAMVRAARRGVTFTICLESPDVSAGRTAIHTIQGVGDELARRSKLYIWPTAKRPTAPNGQRGALHVKVAVADVDTMLITSANLTNSAMMLNMELGLLLHGGNLPRTVKSHFDMLIYNGVLKSIAVE